MAKEKAFVIAERYEGKAKQNEFENQFQQEIFKRLQENAKNQTQSELERICQDFIKATASDYFLKNKYPHQVNLMLEYRAGYPWST